MTLARAAGAATTTLEITVTRTITANPRRTTLASLPTGSLLTSCQAGVDATCVNVATRIVVTPAGERASCGVCAAV